MAFCWDEIASDHAGQIMQKRFPASLSAMDDVYAFLRDTAQRGAVDEKTIDKLLMVAEEIFVNIASYAYTDGGEADIFCCVTGNPLCIHVLFSDAGKPYDPTLRTEADAAASVQSLTPGGLGILMVKRMTDEMEYRRKDGENQLYIQMHGKG